jgi:predicted ATP-grasp superfamily ATP-dependent carboligase
MREEAMSLRTKPGDRYPSAVILGGSFHSLGAARNLAEHGVPVYVLDSGPCVSRFSRAVAQFFSCPTTDDEDEFTTFLVELAAERQLERWVLFPSTDEYVRIVSQHSARLNEHYLTTVPDWEVTRFLYDKRLTHQLAVQQQVPVPETWNPQSLDELASMQLDYPIVVKPAISKHFMAATKKKAYRANDYEELVDHYKTTAAVIDASEILVQELIPGRAENLFSYVGLFKDGAALAGFSGRRSRQHPMDFGRASTYVEIVDVPELETLATQFLGGIAYSGLAEVEFMYDYKHGRYELLEVNPRLWGWHTLAVKAGLDLPYMAYADALGEKVEARAPRNGVAWVRLVTDIPTASREILGGRLSARDYLACFSRNTAFAVLSLRDPLPFIADLVLGPYNYFKGRGF